MKAGTPVAAGGGDQAAQAVGVGAVEPGIVALTVGTSGVVFATTPSALIEPEGRLHAFCHAVPGMWHFMGVMLSAAGSLQWYRDTLAPTMSFDDLLKEATSVPAGSEGLQFLPYLSGERTPYPDPLARGAFIGLDPSACARSHDACRTRRCGVWSEGQLYAHSKCRLGRDHAGARLRAAVRKARCGGRSLASVLDAELVTVNTTEGGAYGAALLAGVGAGAWSDVPSACKAAIKITGSTRPDPAQVEAYRKAYPLYRELYPALKSSFAKMG